MNFVPSKWSDYGAEEAPEWAEPRLAEPRIVDSPEFAALAVVSLLGFLLYPLIPRLEEAFAALNDAPTRSK
jgi:hypothetical protein